MTQKSVENMEFYLCHIANNSSPITGIVIESCSLGYYEVIHAFFLFLFYYYLIIKQVKLQKERALGLRKKKEN